MSRIGNKVINIPASVTIEVKEGNDVTVKGPKGQLNKTFNGELVIKQEENTILVERPNDTKIMKALHGTTRALINNMVVGVSEGYKKVLEMNGVGYRGSVSGSKLTLSLGYSHPVEFVIPSGLTVEVARVGNTNTINITGIDKELVGQFAAEVRAKRKPEPYLGKGIRYSDEQIRRKEGKTAKK